MRIVVKVGTSTLAHSTGRLNIRHTEELVKVLSDLKNAGHEVILVSSGAIGMGIAATIVLVCSNAVISLLRKIIPDKVRIPAYITIIAGFVTMVQMLVKAYAPDIDKALGIYLPLIVVNCIVLGRAEAFAAKNNPVASFFDGLGMGLGFTIALTLLGAVREFLGTGKIFNLTILPEEYGMLVFVLAPGAFIALGYLIALVNSFKKA